MGAHLYVMLQARFHSFWCGVHGEILLSWKTRECCHTVLGVNRSSYMHMLVWTTNWIQSGKWYTQRRKNIVHSQNITWDTVTTPWNDPLWKDNPVWKDHFPVSKKFYLPLDSMLTEPVWNDQLFMTSRVVVSARFLVSLKLNGSRVGGWKSSLKAFLMVQSMLPGSKTKHYGG